MDNIRLPVEKNMPHAVITIFPYDAKNKIVKKLQRKFRIIIYAMTNKQIKIQVNKPKKSRLLRAV